MAFSLSPSVDIREFDLTLTIPNLPSAKTGMVIRSNWGEALKITSITNERDLVREFGEPTSANYMDWYNAWNFLQYASSLYMVRAMDPDAENVGIELTGAGGMMTKEDLSDQNLYNSDVADLEIKDTLPTSVEGIRFYNRYVSSYQPFAVALCDNAADWTKPFCSENIRRLTVTNVDTTADTTATVLTFDYNTMVEGDTFQAGVDGTTVYTVGTVTSTTAEVTPKLTDATGGNLDGTNTLAFETAIDTAANAIFSDGLVNSNGTLAAFNSFFEYEPDWSLGQFAVIVFALDENGVYDVYDDELYVVSPSETGRDSEGRNIFVDEMFYKNSDALYSVINPDTTSGLSTVLSPFMTITGGAVDGTAAPAWLHPASDAQNAAGNWYADQFNFAASDVSWAWDLFSDPETFDINILVSHELEFDVNVQDYAAQLAANRKDCFAIVAPYDYASIVGKTPTEATEYMINTFAGAQYHTPGDLLFNTFSSYVAIYGNMKYQYDKFNDINRWLCIGGDIAGLAAQTHANRDPWWAVAGLERGKIKNVIKPAFNPNKQNRDDLYVNAINPVMSVPGEGVMIVWGQKTGQAKPSAFDRLNVRRLLITLEKAIASASRYALFEFNDEFTRARLRGLIEPFLRDVKGRRGLYDFEVVIDESNNTAEVIDKNALIIDVYLKPTKVAEFIQVNMRVTRTDANFDELIGR